MDLKRLLVGINLLKIFIFSLFVDVGIAIWFYIAEKILIPVVIVLVIIEFIIFWVGMILVYLNSVQLGIKIRVLGIVFAWVPIMNLIMLFKIISVCSKEYKFETALIRRDISRKGEQLCKTKYPILFVHGVFFRDSHHLNYWGRIPKELEKNGARVFYGNHNSADSIKNSAKELEQRILDIVEQTGCEKLNIIAHSKGGLDSRTAIATTSAYKYIASLTTINTPHRGCEFADYFLNKIPKEMQEKIAAKYNKMAEKLGDVNPDFISAVYDLTASSCKKMNKEIKDNSDIYYQSVGSVLQKATSGKFPLNLTHPIVKTFDGENDGLVGVNSFEWGCDYQLLRNEKKRRGISHADVIDLNRENIDGFDVREFYVNLVRDLKDKGF